MGAFTLETVQLDLPALAAAFTRRLRDAGLPAGPERAARFAAALALTAPVARRRLYFTARAVFVTDPGQLRSFDAVFVEVFGGAPPRTAETLPDQQQVPAGEEHDAAPPAAAISGNALSPGATTAPRSRPGAPGERERLVPVLASDEDVLRSTRFDAMTPSELAALYRLMHQLTLQAPLRRRRRTRRHRHGNTVDLRRTLRASLRTGGEPLALARRRRRIEPRRIVLLCDISGSMEPYARAYLQFLTCAAGSPADVEAFTFATRLTRLTRALRSGRPERAIERAAATAPDWSGGTRIAEALATFNDRHGRRGMARGAIVVILSDGWERGDPDALGREMERLSRLAHRIVWVNPRVAARDFSPRTGGMAAALPHCDALVSGHSLAAMEEVITAIAGSAGSAGAPRDHAAVPRVPGDPGAGGDPGAPAAAPGPEEPWGSATPVPGSSVAMPSGYGPSRGRTTPGWGSRG